MSKKSKTGSENGQRLIWDAGCYELPRQRAEIGARMFQAGKSKKKIRRGKRHVIWVCAGGSGESISEHAGIL